MKFPAWALPLFLLSACEFEIPGQKAKDGSAIGYACRVSKKSPEQCMRENPGYSQVAILDGWREADKDVKDKKVDTDFPPPPPVVIPPPVPKTPPPPEKKDADKKEEGEAPAEGEKKPEAEAKPAEAAKGH